MFHLAEYKAAHISSQCRIEQGLVVRRHDDNTSRHAQQNRSVCTAGIPMPAQTPSGRVASENIMPTSLPSNTGQRWRYNGQRGRMYCELRCTSTQQLLLAVARYGAARYHIEGAFDKAATGYSQFRCVRVRRRRPRKHPQHAPFPRCD